MTTAYDLVFIGLVLFALVVLPGLLGADSRDGDDWVSHPDWRQR
jgi:hypothetical protein